MTLVLLMFFVVFSKQQTIMDVSCQTSPTARILYETVDILNNQKYVKENYVKTSVLQPAMPLRVY